MIRYTAVLSPILFSAVFSSIVLGLALPSASACQQWTVPYRIEGIQNNNYWVNFLLKQNGSIVQGLAESGTAYLIVLTRGKAEGSIRANKFHVTVYWNNQTIGVYDGIINSFGRIEGTTYDRWHPNSKAKWVSEPVMVCAR
jgi:hypothetical protein